MIIRDVLDDDIEVAIKVGFFSFILSLVLKQEKNYVIALVCPAPARPGHEQAFSRQAQARA